MKCSKCKYKTPDRIHGMGDYYGFCGLIRYVITQSDKKLFLFWSVRLDNDDCLIEKLLLEYHENLNRRS